MAKLILFMRREAGLVHARKARRGSRGIAELLTSALDAGESSASRPGLFTREERTLPTHWIEEWVCLTAGLDVSEKSRGPAGNLTTPRSSIP